MLKRSTLRESTQGYGNVNETLICKRFNACLDRFEYEYTATWSTQTSKQFISLCDYAYA